MPYGETEVIARIPAESLLAVIDAEQKPALADPGAEVREALEKPLGTPGLSDATSPGFKVALVLDGELPPAISHLAVRQVLDVLAKAGVKDEDVTLILGAGFDGALRGEWAARLVGEEIRRGFKVVCHDPSAHEGLVYVGETGRRTRALLNRHFSEADVRVLLGALELHEFAGYVGGRTGVLPGVSGIATIRHGLSLLTHQNAKPGVLGDNPVHLEMAEVASLAKPTFTLNLVLNRGGGLVKAFGGDVARVLEEGVRALDPMRKVPFEGMADVVVVAANGAPQDLTLSRALAALQNALEVVRKGGVLVLVAECSGGYGNSTLYEWMRAFKTLDLVKREVRRGYEFGCEKAYILMKAMERARVILVSALPHVYASGAFGLETASTVNQALEAAYRVIGRRAKVAVIPHGKTTLPVGARGQEGEALRPSGQG